MSSFLRRHIKKRLLPISSSSIKFRTNDTNHILKALQERTWQQTDEEGPWDILWADPETVQEVLGQQILRENQRVNGFSNESELTDEIKRLRNIRKNFTGTEGPEKPKDNEEFSFGPRSYILPEEKEKFQQDSLEEGNTTWAVKSAENLPNQPEFFQNLLENLNNPHNPKTFIVQEIPKNPFTIGKKQPVLNISCLVKSFLPLTVYLYRDAFASLYSETRHSHSISFNNFEIQIPNQPNSSYNHNNDSSIWPLRKFKTYLISKFDPKKIDNCFINIQHLIIKTLESVQKQISRSRNSFALYNFQISLDSSLKPFLSSVSHNFPENFSNNQEFLLTKSHLLDDLLTIIDMEKILTGLEDQIGGFDLITFPSFQTTRPKTRPSKLGILNTRDANLNKLAKDAATRLLDAYIQKKNKPEPTRLNLTNNENNMMSANNLSSTRLNLANNENNMLSINSLSKRLNFADSENNMLSANSSSTTGPIQIVSPLSPQGLLSPQGANGRTIDLSPTKPDSIFSTRVFKLGRGPRHASDPNLGRHFQAGNTPGSRLKRFISTGANSGGDVTPNSSLPSIKFPSPGNSFVPFMTERIPQHKSSSNTPRNLRKTNKILPPLLVGSEDTERLNKSKFERLLEEAGYEVNKTPISLTEAATPSTATSLKEMIESQKMSELDEKVLRILHRRSGAKRVLKETQSMRALKSTSSAKLSKDEVKKILLKSKTSHYAEDLGEIKEEEEYIVKPSR